MQGTPTPKHVYEELKKERPFCERAAFFHDHFCEGRQTFEHAWIYNGKQIPKKWAIITLCAKAHSVDEFATCGILDKQKNHFLSLRHATREDLKLYPRFSWEQEKRYLNLRYGKQAN